jgi:hypothetical protein
MHPLLEALYASGHHFFLALDGAAFLVTFFMGASQQTRSHELHPQASSTKTIRPQTSHLYLSPFGKIPPPMLLTAAEYLSEPLRSRPAIHPFKHHA